MASDKSRSASSTLATSFGEQVSYGKGLIWMARGASFTLDPARSHRFRSTKTGGPPWKTSTRSATSPRLTSPCQTGLPVPRSRTVSSFAALPSGPKKGCGLLKVDAAVHVPALDELLLRLLGPKAKGPDLFRCVNQFLHPLGAQQMPQADQEPSSRRKKEPRL